MGMTDCLSNVVKRSFNLERLRYYSRQLLTADDMRAEQDYFRAKLRQHNHFMHGWGIVCGLEVNLNAELGPLFVTIRPGYALSPQGDEIYVPKEYQFDLGQCIAGKGAPCHSPCGSVGSAAEESATDFYIAIKYDECMSHPVRVPPVGCGCDETACEYSRIRDSFEVTCLGSLPASHEKKDKQQVEDSYDVAKRTRRATCPPCFDSPWIVLAKLHVNGTVLDAPSFADRRILLSTALL